MNIYKTYTYRDSFGDAEDIVNFVIDNKGNICYFSINNNEYVKNIGFVLTIKEDDMEFNGEITELELPELLKSRKNDEKK